MPNCQPYLGCDDPDPRSLGSTEQRAVPTDADVGDRDLVANLIERTTHKR